MVHLYFWPYFTSPFTVKLRHIEFFQLKVQVQTFETLFETFSHISEPGTGPGAVNTCAEESSIAALRLVFRVAASKVEAA